MAMPLLAENFNARVGSPPDPRVTDVGDSIPPQLQNTDSTVNNSWPQAYAAVCRQCNHFSALAEPWQTPCIAYFQALQITMASRLDHTLWTQTSSLFHSALQCGANQA